MRKPPSAKYIGSAEDWPEPPSGMKFDIEVQGSWPAELWHLFAAAQHGLSDGDLRPLSELMRSQYPIPRAIRERLSDMIEGDKDQSYRLLAKGKKRGQLAESDRNAREFQRCQMGLGALKRLKASGPGEFESVISWARGKYSASRGAVTSALREMDEKLEANYVGLSRAGWSKQQVFEYMCNAFDIP